MSIEKVEVLEDPTERECRHEMWKAETHLYSSQRMSSAVDLLFETLYEFMHIEDNVDHATWFISRMGDPFYEDYNEDAIGSGVGFLIQAKSDAERQLLKAAEGYAAAMAAFRASIVERKDCDES